MYLVESMIVLVCGCIPDTFRDMPHQVSVSCCYRTIRVSLQKDVKLPDFDIRRKDAYFFPRIAEVRHLTELTSPALTHLAGQINHKS